MTWTDEEIEKSDLDIVSRFEKDFKDLCIKHGVLVLTGLSGNTAIYVLNGSSKPAINSNLHLVYRGRK